MLIHTKIPVRCNAGSRLNECLKIDMFTAVAHCKIVTAELENKAGCHLCQANLRENAKEIFLFQNYFQQILRT